MNSRELIDPVNNRRHTKVLMWECKSDSAWEKIDNAWRRKATRVYRSPGANWKNSDGKWEYIYWIPLVHGSDENAQPSLPKWIQCYWDDQSGRWLVLGGGGGGNLLIFRFVTTDYGYGDLSEECGERDEPDELFGEVVKVSCGNSRPVLYEDESGIIPLADDLGIVAGRDFRDVEGRIGFAVLMSDGDESGYGTCYWSIIWANFLRWRQVLADQIWQSKRIKMERELHLVDDHCKLPDEYIEGIDCEDDDDYYQVDAQIIGGS